MYWVGYSALFFNIPRSSAKANSLLLFLNCFLRSHKKIWDTGAFLTLFWGRSPCCKCLPTAFSALVFLSLFQCILSPAKGVASLEKGLTVLSQPWLPLHSLLQNALRSWRQKDTKTYDVFGGAQNNMSVFRQQTFQMGRASSAAGEA